MSEPHEPAPGEPAAPERPGPELSEPALSEPALSEPAPSAPEPSAPAPGARPESLPDPTPEAAPLQDPEPLQVPERVPDPAAPEREPVPAAGSSRPGGRVLALAVLAGLLAASSIALALLVRSQHQEREAFTSARDAAATAASQLIVNLDALSHPTIDRDMERVVNGATGTFKKQFTSSQKQLRAYVVQQRVESKGEVRSVAVVRSDTDTATVMVAVDRTFKDRTRKEGVVATDRWKMTLEKHGGRWLVAELEPVA